MGNALYRIVEHSSDVAIEAEAEDWPVLLAMATVAVGAVILEEDPNPATEDLPIAVQGRDREDVLVAWLTEAILWHERDGVVVRGARAVFADETSARGVLVGRLTDRRFEAPDRVVKAVTHHDLHVEVGDASRPWRVRVVLDL